MRVAAATLALGLALAVLAAAACDRGGSRPRRGEEVLGDRLPVRLGESFSPGAAWEPTAPGSFLATDRQDVLEVETDGGRIVGIVWQTSGDPSVSLERDLHARLGAGVECSPLPPDVPDFRVTLWRLPDGTGVSMSRMLKQLKIRVSRPAGAAFEEALAGCPKRDP